MLARQSSPATHADRLTFGTARGSFMIAAVILQGQATWGVPDMTARHKFVDAGLLLAREDPDGFRELRRVVAAGLDICDACHAHALGRMQPLAQQLAACIEGAGHRP